MKIKLVIFDLDGTLVDAFRAVVDSINFALKKLGYAPQDEYAIKRSVGWGERALLASFVEEKDVDEIQEIYRESHDQTLTYGVKFLDGALKLIEHLKDRGYSLAIATNRPSWSTKRILEELQAEKYFDIVLSKDDVERPKPDAEILERLLKKFKIEPAQAIYVGDMTVDVETGKNAGVPTVAVTTGSSTREELEALNPFKIVENVWEVAGILDELNS
ncbi:MAG: HAD family hydrolase [Candidatus Omnitrophica bacterium]|nr:HAD family hydrolase [Candidatus Omnitrophota bacterium]